MPDKIAIIGPECSGKSTLTQDLATHFSEPFLPEYGRIYLEIYGPSYSFEDLEKISRKMVELEQKQLKNSKQFLFCDTDLLMMKVWYDVKYGKLSNFINEAYNKYSYDYYFICAPDIPWQADPLRENPHIREELFNRYIQEVERQNKEYTIIKGTDRSEDAIKAIEKRYNITK